MRKTLEDFNFKKHNTYSINEIKDYVSHMFSQWLLDTSRQDDYDVHKDTVSYFVYRANLKWNSGQEFITIRESDDSKLIDMLEPIIKNLEDIHDGVRGMVLLIKLKAREQISTHCDSGDYLMLSKRNHIPVVTSDNVFFSVGNEKISMQAGECWEINNSRPHLVENNSDIDRIHLLIDIMPNEELGKK